MAVKVIVLYENGDPDPYTHVGISYTSMLYHTHLSAETDSDGIALFENVEEGKAYIRVGSFDPEEFGPYDIEDGKAFTVRLSYSC